MTPVLSLRDPQPPAPQNGVRRTECDRIQSAGWESEAARPSVSPMSPPRPSELYISDRKGDTWDYSFMSSCSLPSENTSQSSPSTGQETGRVLLRRERESGDCGRLLNSALARHFRRLHCGGQLGPADPSTSLLSDNLHHYLRDVFHQLDCQHTGSVSRQDFTALCEVLNIQQDARPGPSSPSGLQWLPSYQPRPGTPASPLKLDKIREAEVRSPASPSPQQTSFLWTIGPRPFWELWPHKKHKKKKLNLEEFIQCLLEQWAATHRYPVELAAEIMLNKDQAKATAKVRLNNRKHHAALPPVCPDL